MKTRHLIFTGDSRRMNEVNDASVHLIVTSPPYWQLKDYGSDSQIGYHQSYEDYINNLSLVWDECFRVLHSGCRLCVNIGDQFARSVYYGRYKVIPIRTEIIKSCETMGFDYMGAVIWQKVTTSNTTGGASVMGSFPNPRNGIIRIDYEFILIFKKIGKAPQPTMEQKQMSVMSKEEWNEYFSGHWNFAGARQDQHIAVFPEELPTRLIKMFSFAGDVVLDPFLGSGTTSLAARKLSRHSIGYEINPDYLTTIKTKLDVARTDLSQTTYDFKTSSATANPHKEISRLKYIFRDPHKLDKRVDPKKRQFGSKIDKHSSQRENFYTVKEIISPELIRLNNNLLVRLIGIRENTDSNGAATAFIKSKTKGKRIYLRFDDEKYTRDNTLLAYVYQQDKTFINAHLIKNGLANVDLSVNFRYKSKFIKMTEQKTP